MTTHFNWKLDQFDVKTTFLNGDLDEVIYMSQLKGFKVNPKYEKGMFVKKVSFWLKEAPRQNGTRNLTYMFKIWILLRAILDIVSFTNDRRT